MDVDWVDTNRGFHRGEFLDGNREKCSLQESSAIRDEGLIWLGINDVQPKVFYKDGRGWVDVQLPTDGDVLCSGRMHLTQSHVKRLLPALQFFAEHGHLPRESALEQLAHAAEDPAE